MTFQGTVSAIDAIYPAVNIGGASVSQAGIPLTTINSYVVDSDTGALVSVAVIPTSSNSVANAVLTIVESTSVVSNNDYYVYFSTPVPYGKPVTALIGFDR
jgi:hypothetical protein